MSGWEEKVRGLKEELLDLEAEKKGLESVLSRSVIMVPNQLSKYKI